MYQVPTNNEAQPTISSKYVDPDILLSKTKKNMKIEDKGYEKYTMSQAFHIGKLPLSPKS